MPQTVDSESHMAASQINRAGVIAGTTTAVATGAQVLNTVADAGDSAGRITKGWELGTALPIVLGIVVVAMSAYIVWQRVKARKTGWL